MVSVLLKLCLFCAILSAISATETPIIGVVLHETSLKISKILAPNATSYLGASYVKAIEAAGGRVVPIELGKNESYYQNILSHVNGIFFPGGEACFGARNGYADAINILYQEAIKLNKDNDHMPILGVCLGFEILMHLANDRKELRADCDCQRVNLPLHFKPDFQESELFRNADPHILHILSTEPVTSNHHSYCVTEKNLTKNGLDEEWKVLSTNEDVNGFQFISTVESKLYPFVGIQFHPEKCAYEWSVSQNNPHSEEAIYSARFFYDWLIKEAKKSNHSFESQEMELDALIYNYSPIYTGPLNLTYEQTYYF